MEATTASQTSPQRMNASGNQTRYVLAELSGAGSYMISLGHLVEGAFDEIKFQAAASDLVKRHEALRTRFEISDSTVFALISDEPEYQYHYSQTSDQSLSAFRHWALPLVFDRVDPREAGALLRFLVSDYGDRWRFTIAAHHATTDGISRGVMNQELLKLYAGEVLLPASSYYEFADPSATSPEILSSVESLIDDLPEPVGLARGDAERSALAIGQFVQKSFGELRQLVRPMAKSIGTTQFGVMATIYALGLHGFTGNKRVSTFFQTAGRRSLGATNSVIGPFSNMLPLDLSVDLDKDFAFVARSVTAQTRDIVALENQPVLDLTLVAKKAPLVSINMFPPARQIRAGKLEIGPREFLDRRTEFDLNLVWSEDLGTFNARAFYDPARFSEPSVQLFLELQSRLLAAAIDDPDQSCRMLLKKARAGREAFSQRVSGDPEPLRRLHCRFFDLAARNPDATAVVTSAQEISYGELATDASTLCRGVQAAGAGPGDRVIILASRHPCLVAALMGVSASGASFALIDSTLPPAKIIQMADCLDTPYVVEVDAELPREIAKRYIRIAPASASEPVTFAEGPPRNVAYHLFTSGTTGQPKLVSHPDKTAQRFIDWQHQTLALGTPVATMLTAGLGHDPILRDILLPLSHGGKIAIPNPGEMTNPTKLRDLVRRAGCNVLHLSASTGRLVTTGVGSDPAFYDLQAVFWAGERLPVATVKQWQALAPDARQFNAYGATETPQVFLIHHICSADLSNRDIPLGRSLPWNGVRLVAEDGTPVSVGEVGEIVAELPDPVGGVAGRNSVEETHSACHHSTGDMGYQMLDGLVHFIGRRDEQIKLNGYRVELGEVESAAEEVLGVERTCAVFSEERLFLFALSNDTDVTEKTIRGALTSRLPIYMMPTRIVVTSHFPVTPNGKIDKAALEDSILEATGHQQPGEQPLGPTEELIADLFAKHAGQSSASREMSFHDLGTDSLSSIEARFGLEARGLNLPDDWQRMTIAELADIQKLQPDEKTVAVPVIQTSRIETHIVIRSLAILSVVAFHSGFQLTSGASIVLFVLAGFSFGRTQLPAVLKDGHVGRVWALMARLLIPLMVAMLGYVALDLYRGIDTHPSSLLFFRNLTDLIDFVGGVDGADRGLVWLWFVHAYLQMFLIIGLILLLPSARRQLAVNTWRGLAAFFVITEVVSITTLLLLFISFGGLQEIAPLLAKSPTTILPFLAIGALIANAETSQQRIASFALVLFHQGLVWLLYVDHAEFWWVAALVLSALAPHFTLPRFAAKIAVVLATYSLMIYLVHNAAFIVFYKFAGGSEVAIFASTAFQVGCGVAFGILMKPVIDLFGINRLASPKIEFGSKRF